MTKCSVEWRGLTHEPNPKVGDILVYGKYECDPTYDYLFYNVVKVTKVTDDKVWGTWYKDVECKIVSIANGHMPNDGNWYRVGPKAKKGFAKWVSEVDGRLE